MPKFVIVSDLKGKGEYMVKLFNIRLAGLFLLAALLQSCTATKQQETSSPAAQEKPKTFSPSSSFSESPDVIVKIGDYVITNNDLAARLMREIIPQPDYWGESKIYQPTDSRTILMKMIAEDAMLMEARRFHYQDDEEIQDSITILKNESLPALLLDDYLRDKIKVTDEEIESRIKADPKLDRNQAKQMLEGAKAKELIDQFYDKLYKEHKFQKVSANFPKAAEIYRRLLSESAVVYNGKFVRVKQVRQLPPEEKNLVLMTCDNGQVTLKDLLLALCEIAPPSRPANLNTPEGIDSFLSNDFRAPVFVAEACARGLDTKKDFLDLIKSREDIFLFNKVVGEKFKSVPEPKDPYEITSYYEKRKKEFGTPDKLRIDQIWCENLDAARKAKDELSKGIDFESVKEEYSLDKTSGPVDVYPGTEGMFFSYLWKGEPNQIGGPVKGFYKEMLKWRVVKVLSKQPGQTKEYNNSMEKNIKSKLWADKKEAALERYRQDVLMKYQYVLYEERITDILTMP